MGIQELRKGINCRWAGWFRCKLSKGIIVVGVPLFSIIALLNDFRSAGINTKLSYHVMRLYMHA